MDIQLSYTVYFENGMKVGKEGYWGSPEELKQKIGRYLEAAYGSKIKKIEATDGDSEAKAEDADGWRNNFGDVSASALKTPGGSYVFSISVTTDGIISAFSANSVEECISKAQIVEARLKKKYDEMKKAIEWMKKNVKI